MKKNLKKATIMLLVFSMTLTNFSMIVRADEPMAHETEGNDAEETIRIPTLEDIDYLIESAEEVKSEEDINKMPPLKFPVEFPEVSTRSFIVIQLYWFMALWALEGKNY